MSYTDYQNNYNFTAKSERFTAENDITNIEETAILLVTKTLAEANAEEILNIVLDHALDIVCPQIPGCLELSEKYDKPLVTSPSLSNILSVLEMENNLPVQHQNGINYHSDHSSETTSEESLEEPVFTSPIYVKSGPENINILEENTMSESCDSSECTTSLEKIQDLESSADLKYVAKEDIVKAESTSAEENEEILFDGSKSKMNIDNCHACMNISKAQINEKDNTDNSENIGDANETINNAEKIEAKSSSTGQKLSLTGQVIGDVVPDLPVSDDEIHPQVVQAYVLFPDGPGKADDTISAKNENTLTTDMEGDSLDLNNLNKEEDTSSSNEVNLETRPPLVANEVGDLLDYFQQEYNSLESTASVNVADKPSDEGMESSVINEVKRAVKEIAAAVFEGKGDGTPTELSNISPIMADRQEQSSTPDTPVINPEPPTNISLILAVHQDQSSTPETPIINPESPTNISLLLGDCQDESSTPEILVVNPEPLPNINHQLADCQETLVIKSEPQTSTDQFWSSPLDSKQQPSTSTTDKEVEIAVHESLSVEPDLTEFLSDMHKQDEMEEREVQIILHDDDEDDIISINEAVCDSDSENTQFSDYLAAPRTAQTDSQEELFDTTSRSNSHLNLSLKRSYIDSSKLKNVVDETYSLEKMAKNMKMKNPKLKANLSRQAVGRVRNTNARVLKSTEDTPHQERNGKWGRAFKLLTCRERPSDEP